MGQSFAFPHLYHGSEGKRKSVYHLLTGSKRLLNSACDVEIEKKSEIKFDVISLTLVIKNVTVCKFIKV